MRELLSDRSEGGFARRDPFRQSRRILQCPGQTDVLFSPAPSSDSWKVPVRLMQYHVAHSWRLGNGLHSGGNGVSAPGPVAEWLPWKDSLGGPDSYGLGDSEPAHRSFRGHFEDIGRVPEQGVPCLHARRTVSPKSCSETLTIL